MAWGAVELEPEVEKSILLTVFHKTRMRDEREIDRARRALARCIDEAHEVVDEED